MSHKKIRGDYLGVSRVLQDYALSQKIALTTCANNCSEQNTKQYKIFVTKKAL